MARVDKEWIKAQVELIRKELNLPTLYWSKKRGQGHGKVHVLKISEGQYLDGGHGTYMTLPELAAYVQGLVTGIERMNSDTSTINHLKKMRNHMITIHASYNLEKNPQDIVENIDNIISIVEFSLTHGINPLMRYFEGDLPKRCFKCETKTRSEEATK